MNNYKGYSKMWLIVLLLLLVPVFMPGCSSSGGSGSSAGSLIAAIVASGVTSPAVNLVNPANGAVNVAINRKVAATFSKSMNPSTITTTTFTLTGSGVGAVSGTVAYVGLIATFVPSSNLAANTAYTATITTVVNDLAGNAMAANYIWSFTTGTGTLTQPVALGTIAPFGSFGAAARG